jgi:hypothetical protein
MQGQTETANRYSAETANQSTNLGNRDQTPKTSTQGKALLINEIAATYTPTAFRSMAERRRRGGGYHTKAIGRLVVATTESNAFGTAMHAQVDSIASVTLTGLITC